MRPNASNSAAMAAESHSGRINAPVPGSIAGSQPATLPDTCPIQPTTGTNRGANFPSAPSAPKSVRKPLVAVELAFLGHALEGFIGALDAVLVILTVRRKQLHDPIDIV